MVHKPQKPSDMWYECNCIKQIKDFPIQSLEDLDIESGGEATVIIYFYPKFIMEVFGMRDENGRLGTS